MSADLMKNVNVWTKSVNRNSAQGLRLMVDLVETGIAKHRDWDAAAALLSSAKNMGDKRIGATITTAFKLIIRARFGDRIKLELDKAAKHGFKFTMAWDAGYVPAKSNSWVIVEQAIHNNLGYANDKLLKDLKGELDGGGEENKKEYNIKAAAKRIVTKLNEEQIPLAVMILALQEQLKADTAKNNPVFNTPVVPVDDNVVDIDAAKAA